MKVQVYKLGENDIEEFECDSFEIYSNKASGSASPFIRLKNKVGREAGTMKYRTVALIPNDYIIKRID